MQPRHRVSRTAIDLIKRFEGYRQKAAQLPDGRWTIGHGHTLTARQGAQVSLDDAEALLLYDLIAVAHAVNEQVYSQLSQNQFDALASFTFNIGLESFGRSGVLKRLNEGSPILAACAMELWRKAEIGGEAIVVDALVRRRAAEKALFLTPGDGVWVAAPSPILKPLVDIDAHDLVPHEVPAEVITSLEGEEIVVRRDGESAPAPVWDDEEATGPAIAAAEAVTARLSTIFQAPPEAPVPETGDEEPPTEPAEIAGEDAPDAIDLNSAPEALEEAAPEVPEPEPPFTLQPPVFADEPEIEAEPENDPPFVGPDLFARPDEATPDAAIPETAPELEAAEPEPEPEPEPDAQAEEPERRVIDDSVPYFFERPLPEVAPEPPQTNILTLLGLGVLGLVFFGGGIFWATYARPMSPGAVLGPRLVGGLAGIAGVGFFVVAVYLLLERLGRASERDSRTSY